MYHDSWRTQHSGRRRDRIAVRTELGKEARALPTRLAVPRIFPSFPPTKSIEVPVSRRSPTDIMVAQGDEVSRRFLPSYLSFGLHCSDKNIFYCNFAKAKEDWIRGENHAFSQVLDR
jgi:hypothetical protein